jgi:hypothetical protein
MTKVTEEVSENIIVFTHAPYYIWQEWTNEWPTT